MSSVSPALARRPSAAPWRSRIQAVGHDDNGPDDADSSLRMSEQVGRRLLDTRTPRILGTLRSGESVLCYAIGRPTTFEEMPIPRAAESWRRVQIASERRPHRRGSPAPSLTATSSPPASGAVGVMVTLIVSHGFVAGHAESLREHDALSLRQYVVNLVQRSNEATDGVGQ
ncbi:MAG: hypothetical protein ACHQFZ_10640 [Acidimicrobiales bacterium]